MLSGNVLTQTMERSFWTELFDLISPRLCPSCHRRLSAEESALCAACRLHLPLTHFEQTPEDNHMARRFWGQIPIERAAALFYYEPGTLTGELVHALKYGHKKELAESMGRLAASTFAAKGFFQGIDVLVPIPLTRFRQWQRGYNQSHQIARGISSLTGIPIANRVVRRVHFAGSQTHQSVQSRWQNVENAFRLCRPEAIAGQHVLIVDDVVTTGATTISCALELLKAGNVTISILSLGYTR